MKCIVKIVLAAFILISILTTPVLAGRTVKWKLAETWPSTLTPIASPPAQLAILDMVKGGQYQMGHSASYYWKGKDINTVFFTTLPSDSEHKLFSIR